MNDYGPEPDYEGITWEREANRGERRMERLDRQYGRVEDWRKPEPTDDVDGQ